MSIIGRQRLVVSNIIIPDFRFLARLYAPPVGNDIVAVATQMLQKFSDERELDPTISKDDEVVAVVIQKQTYKGEIHITADFYESMK